VAWDQPFPLGFYGNKAILLYNPSTDDHPSVELADAIADNLFYCNSWGLFASQTAELEDGYITGHPDRSVFTPMPIEVRGEVTQKMLARGDGSPDYVTMRMYEHARHAWAGKAYSVPSGGGGVQGIPASPYAPQFSLFTDVFGVFSHCQVDTIELSAQANEQAQVKYGLVATRQWADDAQDVRSLLTMLGTSENAQAPMRQVFCHDCGITVGDAGDTVGVPFDMPAGGTSELIRGYFTGDSPIEPGRYLVGMSLKIENFMQPNWTMRSTKYWDADVATRNSEARSRFDENIWPREYVNVQQRRITGELTWITDVFPFEVWQRIAGSAGNQIYDPTGLLGQSVLFQFGPLVVKLMDPVWNIPAPRLTPQELFVVQVKLTAASDGPLVLQPTEDWTA